MSDLSTEAGIVDAVNERMELRELAAAALVAIPAATDAIVLVIEGDSLKVYFAASGREAKADVGRLIRGLAAAAQGLVPPPGG